MLVSEAIERIRNRTNDEFETGYSDEVIINYINDAKEYLSHALIAKNDPELTKTMVVSNTGTTSVPKNFVKFAGGFPVRRQGRLLHITDPTLNNVVVKYFYVPDNVTQPTDTMPFVDTDKYDMVVVNLASIYAVNQHEYNIQQDNTLLQQINMMIDQAMEVQGQ